MNNVIQFPSKGKPDSETIHSVVDALRVCVDYTHEGAVLDAHGHAALHTVIDTIEKLWHNMIDESE
jgi:general stress protein 26